MSTETIVNRVPETAGLRLERERLESETAQENRATQIDGLIEKVKLTAIPIPKEFNITPAPSVPITPPAAQENSKEPDSLELDSYLPTEAPTDVPVSEFNEFKQRVIAGFKHLGLDTRKHFGV